MGGVSVSASNLMANLVTFARGRIVLHVANHNYAMGFFAAGQRGGELSRGPSARGSHSGFSRMPGTMRFRSLGAQARFR